MNKLRFTTNLFVNIISPANPITRAPIGDVSRDQAGGPFITARCQATSYEDTFFLVFSYPHIVCLRNGLCLDVGSSARWQLVVRYQDEVRYCIIVFYLLESLPERIHWIRTRGASSMITSSHHTHVYVHGKFAVKN